MPFVDGKRYRVENNEECDGEDSAEHPFAFQSESSDFAYGSRGNAYRYQVDGDYEGTEQPMNSYLQAQGGSDFTSMSPFSGMSTFGFSTVMLSSRVLSPAYDTCFYPRCRWQGSSEGLCGEPGKGQLCPRDGRACAIEVSATENRPQLAVAADGVGLLISSRRAGGRACGRRALLPRRRLP